MIPFSGEKKGTDMATQRKTSGAEHPRLHIRGLIPLDLCKEMEFIHKSCGTVGYRPHVFSTTLAHLVATNSSHLLLPFLPIRERLRETVEEFFGCEYELFIEFTGLISWCKGANIGWHSDNNRPYLKQRDFAAVCYLNSYDKDFKGGIFHFQEGEPASVVPMAGDALIYTADDRNVHSVDEVMDGERLTLTLWFTRDSSYDEDAKLVALLSQISLDSQNNTCVPFPASNHMYWYSPDPASQYGVNGFDVRWARLHILGYSLYSDLDRIQNSRSNSSSDPLDLLNQPMRLGRDGKVFEMTFHNNLHALQVVLFYCWKVSDLKSSKGIEEDIQTTLQQSSQEEVSDLNTVLHFDSQVVEAFFCEDRFTFDWNDFSIAISAWEEYVHRLRKELMSRIPQWSLGNQLC